jgi:hypothetical protein
LLSLKLHQPLLLPLLPLLFLQLHVVSLLLHRHQRRRLSRLDRRHRVHVAVGSLLSDSPVNTTVAEAVVAHATARATARGRRRRGIGGGQRGTVAVMVRMMIVVVVLHLKKI